MVKVKSVDMSNVDSVEDFVDIISGIISEDIEKSIDNKCTREDQCVDCDKTGCKYHPSNNRAQCMDCNYVECEDHPAHSIGLKGLNMIFNKTTGKNFEKTFPNREPKCEVPKAFIDNVPYDKDDSTSIDLDGDDSAKTMSIMMEDSRDKKRKFVRTWAPPLGPVESDYKFDQSAKADAGKPRLGLVPTYHLDGVAKVREFGNKKYGDPQNWKTVEPERYIDSMLRHLKHWQEDPNAIDEESGLSSWDHFMTNAIFLSYFIKECGYGK